MFQLSTTSAEFCPGQDTARANASRPGLQPQPLDEPGKLVFTDGARGTTGQLFDSRTTYKRVFILLARFDAKAQAKITTHQF